jgi:hypothetical protein
MKAVNMKGYRAELCRIDRKSDALYRAAISRWEAYHKAVDGKAAKPCNPLKP